MDELLQKIDCRLNRVEERLKDLHQIKTQLDGIQKSLTWVQVRYAALAAVVSLLVSGASKLL